MIVKFPNYRNRCFANETHSEDVSMASNGTVALGHNGFCKFQKLIHQWLRTDQTQLRSSIVYSQAPISVNNATPKMKIIIKRLMRRGNMRSARYYPEFNHSHDKSRGGYLESSLVASSVVDMFEDPTIRAKKFQKTFQMLFVSDLKAQAERMSFCVYISIGHQKAKPVCRVIGNDIKGTVINPIFPITISQPWSYSKARKKTTDTTFFNSVTLRQIRRRESGFILCCYFGPLFWRKSRLSATAAKSDTTCTKKIVDAYMCNFIDSAKLERRESLLVLFNNSRSLLFRQFGSIFRHALFNTVKAPEPSSNL